MAAMAGISVGIDLGTTNTCLAYWKEGKAQVMKNEFAQSTTASCVNFNSYGYSVGYSDIRAVDSCNTIFEAKRLIGRNFETATNFANGWPFSVVNDGKSIPQYEVEHLKKKKRFYPEQISAIILKEMKHQAECHLKQPVQNVVITVPAYFDETQRESTKIAADIAGLNALKIISEPAAAALTYGLNTNILEEKNILVYDIGKCTLNMFQIHIGH